MATSGGKDSAAMALWLRFESGLAETNPMRFVFNDTGHENPLTIRWLDGDLARALDAPIERTEATETFASLAVRKRRFPSVKARFCTQFLKVVPMGRWMAAHCDATAILCQGIRADESARRAAMTEWDSTLGDYDGFYDIWRPILQWDVDAVFACHARHGLPPNPLYSMGAGRVGCWPCIHVRIGEMREAFRRDADLLPRLERMEAAVVAASARGMASFFAHNYIPARFHDREGLRPAKLEERIAEALAQDLGCRSCDDPQAPEPSCAGCNGLGVQAADLPDLPAVRFTFASIRAVHDYVLGLSQGDLWRLDDGSVSDAPTCMSQYGLCE